MENNPKFEFKNDQVYFINRKRTGLFYNRQRYSRNGENKKSLRYRCSYIFDNKQCSAAMLLNRDIEFSFIKSNNFTHSHPSSSICEMKYIMNSTQLKSKNSLSISLTHGFWVNTELGLKFGMYTKCMDDGQTIAMRVCIARTTKNSQHTLH